MIDIRPSHRTSPSTREAPTPMSDRFSSNPRAITSLAMILSLAGLAGCLEQTDDLLGTAPLPAIDPTITSNQWTGSSVPSLRSDQDPAPWSRADWAPIQVAVPMASTIHQPTYVDQPLTSKGEHTAGRCTSPSMFPTSESALVVETDRDEVLLAAVTAPFTAALNLIESPIRMILAPPWTASAGPRGGWILLPRVPTIDAEGSS